MFGDDDKKVLLEAVVFRPLHVWKCFDDPKTTSTRDDVNDNNSVASGIIPAGRSDAASTSSFIFKRLTEFYVNENMDFEKWVTLKGMKVAFFTQTMLGLIRRAFSASLIQQNRTSLSVSNVSSGLRNCLMRSIFGGALMAVNVGCIIISITQFAVWCEYFSLWTVPFATTVIPTVFSRSLSVKPQQAIKGGLLLGVLSSLTIYSVSLLYDLPVDETYQYIKNSIEIGLKKERESALYRFMKEHNIRSKWFGKWMLKRSQINENIDDELL